MGWRGFAFAGPYGPKVPGNQLATAWRDLARRWWLPMPLSQSQVCGSMPPRTRAPVSSSIRRAKLMADRDPDIKLRDYPAPLRPDDMFVGSSALLLFAAWESYEHSLGVLPAVIFSLVAVGSLWSGYAAQRAYDVARFEFDLAGAQRRYKQMREDDRRDQRNEPAETLHHKIKSLEALIAEAREVPLISRAAIDLIRRYWSGALLVLFIGLANWVWEHDPEIQVRFHDKWSVFFGVLVVAPIIAIIYLVVKVPKWAHQFKRATSPQYAIERAQKRRVKRLTIGDQIRVKGDVPVVLGDPQLGLVPLNELGMVTSVASDGGGFSINGTTTVGISFHMKS
jgi:hypothetical protein